MIVVDQLRFPRWFSPAAGAASACRRTSRACVAARSPSPGTTPPPTTARRRASTLLTGLYTHQTGCMITGGSTLDPGFPTWGTMLREHGYHTCWYGKWHLTHGDNHWSGPRAGRCSSATASRAAPTRRPTARPARAGAWIRTIAAQFARLVRARGPAASRGARRSRSSTRTTSPGGTAGATASPAEAQAPQRSWRTAAELRDARAADRAQQAAAAALAAGDRGRVVRAGALHGPEAAAEWLPFLDLYVKLQLEVDQHIGRVLRPLREPPGGRGEHGDRVHLRPRRVRRLARAARQGRRRLRGGHPRAADRQGLRAALLTQRPRTPRDPADLERRPRAAAADDRERLDALAPRAALLPHRRPAPISPAILADPTAPGRRYVLHATDEIVTEFAIEPYAADAPLHVVALRTPNAKYATYSNWPATGIEPLCAAGRNASCTTTAPHAGRLELAQQRRPEPAGGAAARASSSAPFAEELRRPLPPHLTARARARLRRLLLRRPEHVVAEPPRPRRKLRSEREVRGRVRPVRHRLSRNREGAMSRARAGVERRTPRRPPAHGARGRRSAVSKPVFGAAPPLPASAPPARTRRAPARTRLRVAPFQLA